MSPNVLAIDKSRLQVQNIICKTINIKKKSVHRMTNIKNVYSLNIKKKNCIYDD